MIRALPLLLLLTACASFPQVDAAAPDLVPPRPDYLTPTDLAAANAAAAQTDVPTTEDDAAALRARADDLRAR